MTCFVVVKYTVRQHAESTLTHSHPRPKLSYTMCSILKACGHTSVLAAKADPKAACTHIESGSPLPECMAAFSNCGLGIMALVYCRLVLDTKLEMPSGLIQ